MSQKLNLTEEFNALKDISNDQVKKIEELRKLKHQFDNLTQEHKITKTSEEFLQATIAGLNESSIALETSHSYQMAQSTEMDLVFIQYLLFNLVQVLLPQVVRL